MDALVSDVVMPGMGGIALAEAVLDRSGIRVVLLSGYTAGAALRGDGPGRAASCPSPRREGSWPRWTATRRRRPGDARPD
ncbi:MAG: hypothetical protein U0838_17035 [Chloroflexota bacterium]